MTPLPVISVIMPAYNARDTIAASIQSLQAQTLKNWELIIVDDGSPDDTAAIALAMAEKDARICVVQRPNSGPSIARNRGVDLARADLIAFLDADDFWAPERLLGMLSLFDGDPSVGVAFSRTRFVDDPSLKLGTLTPYKSSLSVVDLMSENAVCSTSNIVCLKSVFERTGGFTPGLDYAEDQDWLLRVALEGKCRIVGVDAEWFFYRSSSHSQSADLGAMRDGWIQMVGAACIDYPEKAACAAREAYGPYHRQLARRAIRMHDARAGLKYILAALRHDPLLIFRQPARTCLTLAGVLITFIPNAKLKELAAR
ncbi:MAG: glycosyltransferase family 2 protein [Pseudomonadota bacterium]